MSFGITKDSNIQPNVLKFLFKKYSNEESPVVTEPRGGFLSNLKYAWLINNSKFLVVSYNTCTRVGSWDFGYTLQDETTEILSVNEIQRPHGREPLLVVSLNCVTKGGIICIVDFLGSKVIRAIRVGEKISSVHIIDGGLDIFSLSGPLRNFDGVLAVGTIGGNVYIVDICKQFCYEEFGTLDVRDELNPCELQVVTFEDLLDIENHKKAALKNELHLAIHLNVVLDNTTEHFVLKAPNGADKVHVNKQEVLISALHYCPQLGSILVGYNFGAYQLWNLMTMELIYTSPICEDHVPISKFAIQEPADDPRAFCYIWAVYSSDDDESEFLPYLVMYALCYESKEFQEGYGILYENFQYCAVRFHMELGFSNNSSAITPKGGKCLRLESITLKNSMLNNDECTGDGVEDMLSLCIIIWKICCENGQFTYMAVFDLNQWYKAQMPNSPSSDDCSSYMITISITDLVDSIEVEDVFDVVLNKKTLTQFIGTQRLEEHYYPSSLSFGICCLLQYKIVAIQYQGIQKALLYQMKSAGPICLIRPTETYQEIVSFGLMPLFVEAGSSTGINVNFQREVILNVALEQQLTSWLCKCATEWANGSFSSAGCSLDLLTSWAFQRAIVLKHNCDNLCVSLFDYSEVKLDANTRNILNNCIRQIKNISFFYTFIVRNLSAFFNNVDQLFERCSILQTIEKYFEVLQWLFNVGLLPEYAFSSDQDRIQGEKIRAPYPVHELTECYRTRRSELLISLHKRFSLDCSMLFIDNLINIECGGDRLIQEWRKDGGDGFYPPRSLQALLRTYLMEGIDVYNKHLVVIYLFLDLAMVLDPTKYRTVITHLIKFPAVFKVSPSLIKITQAFWQLDHGDFATAMEQLLDPLVNQEDLKNWHHKIALKSLLIQEQYNSALLYMSIKKPPILDDEDVLCTLSLYVSNHMLDEAFYLEKHYEQYFNSKKFIKHLFAECSKHNCLENILYRNLTDEEEEIFLKYLDEVKHPNAMDLKITYFMQRSHYMEAFQTYQKCGEDPTRKGLIARLNSKATDQIVHAYKKLIPSISFKFIESCTQEPNPGLWKEVTRPEPMSVCVHKADEKVEYKSSLIYAALGKAKQTFNGNLTNVPTLTNVKTEEIPFLRTPTLPPSRKRSSVQVLIPKVAEDEEDSVSPKKKARYSDKFDCRLSQSSLDVSSILVTPIIRRKEISRTSTIERRTRELTATPTSILKNTSMLASRKSISRLSNVRFDVPSTSSSESHLSSSRKSPFEREARTPDSSASISLRNSSKKLSLTPKNASDSGEVYYSPNSSLNNIEELPRDEEIEVDKPSKIASVDKDYGDGVKEGVKESGVVLKGMLLPEKPAVISEAKLIKLVDYDPSSSSKEDSNSTPLKGRRSYKRLTNEYSSIRSSPRLSRSRELITSEMISSSSKSSKVNERQESASGSSAFSLKDGDGDSIVPTPSTSSKVKPRKSLNRQVLENNTFSALAMAAAESVETSRTSVFCEEKRDISGVAEGAFSDLSYRKTEYSDVYVKESSTSERFTEKHSIKEVSGVVLEMGLDSQENNWSIQTSLEGPKKSLISELSDSFLEEIMEHVHQRPKCESMALHKKESDDSLKSCTEQPNISRKSEEIPILPNPESSSSQISDLPAEISKSCTENSRVITQTEAPENVQNTSQNKLQARKSASLTSIQSPRRSRRLSAERTLPDSDVSVKEVEKVEILKLSTKPKARKSLSRQVLEGNALAMLTSEYQSSGESNQDMPYGDVQLEQVAQKDVELEKDVEEDAMKIDEFKENQETSQLLGPLLENLSNQVPVQEDVNEDNGENDPIAANTTIDITDLRKENLIHEEKQDENDDSYIVYADLDEESSMNFAFIESSVINEASMCSITQEETPPVLERNIMINPDEDLSDSKREVNSSKAEIIEIRSSSSENSSQSSSSKSSSSSSKSSSSSSKYSPRFSERSSSSNELNKNILLIECDEEEEEVKSKDSKSGDQKFDEITTDTENTSLPVISPNEERMVNADEFVPESSVQCEEQQRDYDQAIVIQEQPMVEDNDEQKADEIDLCSQVCDDISENSSNPQDPKMNVFEISDVLSSNECIIATEPHFNAGDMATDMCVTQGEDKQIGSEGNIMATDDIMTEPDERISIGNSDFQPRELEKSDAGNVSLDSPKPAPGEFVILPTESQQTQECEGNAEVGNEDNADNRSDRNSNEELHVEIERAPLKKLKQSSNSSSSYETEPSTSSKVVPDIDALTTENSNDGEGMQKSSLGEIGNRTYGASSKRKTRSSKKTVTPNVAVSSTIFDDVEKQKENEEADLKKRPSRVSLSREPISLSEINLRVKLPEIDVKIPSKSIRTYGRKRANSVDTPMSTTWATPSVSAIEEGVASTSKSSESPRPRALRRLRSASVEYTNSYEDPWKASAARSEEGSEKQPSLFEETVVDDMKDGRRKKRKSDTVVKRSTVETYAMARRLTRRQANILGSALKKVEELEEATDDSTEDRIKLMDKKVFEGVPDLEEQRVYDTSPSSSGTSPNAPAGGRRLRRQVRSSSIVSATSSVTSNASVKSETKSSALKESPTVRGSRRLLRSASVDRQIEGKRSRRSKKTLSETGSVSSEASSTISTRSKRTTTSKKSEESSVKGKKRKVAAASNLAKIKEESTEVSSESPVRRGTRNSKNQAGK